MRLAAETRLAGAPSAGRRETGSTRRTRGALYELHGPLAWVERGGGLAVLHVQDGNRRGRRLRGRALTVELTAARVMAPDRNGDGRRTPADLLPGERVTVRVRLPRRLDTIPARIAARVVVSGEAP
ncbi:MAG TPA: hypothetical protein VFT50_03785 [Baekduia sp.]|nr:hypothetical protein [Baekduia sp.]